MLLPILKKLGYECYFDEAPSQDGLQSRIKFCESQIEEAVKRKKDFEVLGLDINDEYHEMQYFVILAKHNGCDNISEFAQKYHNEYYTIKMAIAFYKNRLASIDFLKSLENNKMNYKAIDWGEYKLISEAISLEGMQKRNKMMASAYLDSESSVFGFIGLGHVEGIQREISNNISHEVASEQFCFFSLYSYTPDDLGKKAINKELGLPFNLICIDASRNNKDKIIDIILREIYHRTLPRLNLSSARDSFFAIDDKGSLPPLALSCSLDGDISSISEQNLPRLCSLSLSRPGDSLK